MGLSQAYLTSRSAKDAANRAASAEERAADLSIAEQRRQFDLTRSDLAPWMETGRGALNQLAQLYGIGGNAANGDGADYSGPIDPNTGRPTGAMAGPGSGADSSAFFASPDYRFALEQGEQAAMRGGSAMGNLRSGNTLAALTNYGQGLASQQFGNYTNRLAALAGVGQQSASSLGELGANMAGQISQAYTNASNARASGIIGANVAQTNAYNQASQNTLSFGSSMGWFGARPGSKPGGWTPGYGRG